MSLTVKLFQFSKKLNSTAVPIGTTPSVTYADAYIIDQTDIVNPSIRFMYVPGSTNPTTYNYAQISEFSRYYFIDSWRWTNDGWIADMTVDALASFKSAIGASSVYVFRSASNSDGDVIDRFFPMKTSCQINETSLTQPWTYSLSGGCFVIGVISKDANYGSVRYCAMDYTSFTTLCTALLQDSILSGSGYSTADATYALQKSLVDPLQYIVSCVFIPIPLANIVGTSRTTLTVWEWTVNVNNTEITLNPYSDNSGNFTLTKHPATATRGNFCNASPFTRVELSFPPFGLIQLDTSITATKPYIYYRYSVDYISGEGTLRVFAQENASSVERVLIAEVSAQVGIPVQLSQMARNGIGLLTGGLTAFFNDLGSVFGFDAGISSSNTSMTSHLSTVSQNGAFYRLQYTPALYETWMDMTADDNTNHGRPLMGIRQISNLTGYIQGDSSGMTISGALARELEIIKGYIDGGFYYE